MENYLLAANVVVWLGICGYVGFLALAQRSLERRLKQLETLHGDR
ncbi:hypothetical protein JCM15519_02620 [Fundidesulfovibrio butyratiphilus]